MEDDKEATSNVREFSDALLRVFSKRIATVTKYGARDIESNQLGALKLVLRSLLEICSRRPALITHILPKLLRALPPLADERDEEGAEAEIDERAGTVETPIRPRRLIEDANRLFFACDEKVSFVQDRGRPAGVLLGQRYEPARATVATDAGRTTKELHCHYHHDYNNTGSGGGEESSSDWDESNSSEDEEMREEDDVLVKGAIAIDGIYTWVSRIALRRLVRLAWRLRRRCPSFMMQPQKQQLQRTQKQGRGLATRFLLRTLLRSNEDDGDVAKLARLVECGHVA